MKYFKLKKLKSVADFKRAMVVGSVVRSVLHQFHAGRDENGVIMFKDGPMQVRKVAANRSKDFACLTLTTGGLTESWCNWPGKYESVFNEDGSITILDEDWREGSPTKGQLIPLLTYAPIEKAEQYVAASTDGTETHSFFADGTDMARHWVINHLDCSKEWKITEQN